MDANLLLRVAPHFSKLRNDRSILFARRCSRKLFTQRHGGVVCNILHVIRLLESFA